MTRASNRRSEAPASPQRRRIAFSMASGCLLAAVGAGRTSAQPTAPYRALVCIFLQGGNDGENTLIRLDSAGYANYAAVRPVASGINIAQSTLLPIQPANGLPPYGFHPSCAALQSLFNQRKLAVVANMGMLVRPSTKVGLEEQGAPQPANLFSHSDQELEAQSADFGAMERTGWGGRIADGLTAINAPSLFPAVISVAGLRTFASGRHTLPLVVPEGNHFALVFSSGNGQTDALRESAMRNLLALSRSNQYELAASDASDRALAASTVVHPILSNPSSPVLALFAGQNSSIARQLRNIALLIEARATIGLKRQVFFVNQNGYDTHGDQPGTQGRLLAELSRAVGSFQDAMELLSVGRDVTAFTLSDFGRTFKPAAGNGTDHGWGNYAFVIGGAVNGGAFYGTVPTIALNGQNDFGSAGRWIPTTSLEQYGATLARWLGVDDADLPQVFPNIAEFPTAPMGFMA